MIELTELKIVIILSKPLIFTPPDSDLIAKAAFILVVREGLSNTSFGWLSGPGKDLGDTPFGGSKPATHRSPQSEREYNPTNIIRRRYQHQLFNFSWIGFNF